MTVLDVVEDQRHRTAAVFHVDGRPPTDRQPATGTHPAGGSFTTMRRRRPSRWYSRPPSQSRADCVHPEHAVRTFRTASFEALVLENHFVARRRCP